jgi:hypothetical protein
MMRHLEIPSVKKLATPDIAQFAAVRQPSQVPVYAPACLSGGQVQNYGSVLIPGFELKYIRTQPTSYRRIIPALNATFVSKGSIQAASFPALNKRSL